MNKLTETRSTIDNQDIIRRVDKSTSRIESGNAYDTKRGIDFLKSNEHNYENADDTIKKKLFRLSTRLARGQLNQVRTSNRLLNIFLSDNGC